MLKIPTAKGVTIPVRLCTLTQFNHRTDKWKFFTKVTLFCCITLKLLKTVAMVLMVLSC